MKRALAFWIAVACVSAGVFAISLANRHRDASRVGSAVVRDTETRPTSDTQEPPLTEWEFVDQRGQRFRSTDLQGKVWGGSFFFASCPSTCFNQNVRLQQLQSEFAERGLVLVSITCDPANDTAGVLARYATRFRADPAHWHFLTPSGADLRYVTRVGRDFFQLAIGPGTHSDRVVLFDSEGNQVGSYSVLDGIQYGKLRDKLNELLPTTHQTASSTESRP